jgi:hypothetical protein
MWRKFLPLSGLERRPLGRPANSQSLYRLRYPGSMWIRNSKTQSEGKNHLGNLDVHMCITLERILNHKEFSARFLCKVSELQCSHLSKNITWTAKTFSAYCHYTYETYTRQSQWPCSLRHELSSLARTLRSWLRIAVFFWDSGETRKASARVPAMIGTIDWNECMVANCFHNDEFCILLCEREIMKHQLNFNLNSADISIDNLTK